MIVWAAVIAAAFFSWALCAAVRANAEKWHLVDVPNQRSSHAAPTPRGGGIGIVVAFYGTLSMLVVADKIELTMALVMLPAIPIALLGLIDDRKSQGVVVRLFVQLVCAAAIVWMAKPDVLATDSSLLYALGLMVLTTYTAWLINLYNFMDGIDGIAATQAITVLTGVILISWWHQGGVENVSWLLLLAACGGFLLWNWSPARLFMGDVGSTFIGAVLAAWSLDSQSVPLASWLILLAAFLGDASFTLVRRAWRREPVWQAHRSHLYQHLSRRWQSHARVCRVLAIFNLCWLLPLALLAAYLGRLEMPVLQGAVVVMAYLPVVRIAYNMT